jgi:5-methylcytosine-specific restriction endonuclease McrA
VEGSLCTGFPTAEKATQWIESYDTDFWTYGHAVSWGTFGGIEIECVAGHLDAEQTDHVVVLSVPDMGKFPSHLQKMFTKQFFSKASCVKCGAHTSEINFRPLFEYGNKTKRRVPYIVCNCGYPVWRIPQDVCYEIEHRITISLHARDNTLQRKEILAITGGKHTKREIQEILTLQENRCIYCNVLFTEKEIPTRDHLKPILRGGTDWALNIVMACRSCNSRRSLTHFRAHCKRLSPTQNQRILQHLCRRIDAIDLEHVPSGVLAEISRLKRLRSRLANDSAGSQDKKTAGKKPATGKGRLTMSATARKRMAAK